MKRHLVTECYATCGPRPVEGIEGPRGAWDAHARTIHTGNMLTPDTRSLKAYHRRLTLLRSFYDRQRAPQGLSVKALRDVELGADYD